MRAASRHVCDLRVAERAEQQRSTIVECLASGKGDAFCTFVERLSGIKATKSDFVEELLKGMREIFAGRSLMEETARKGLRAFRAALRRELSCEAIELCIESVTFGCTTFGEGRARFRSACPF